MPPQTLQPQRKILLPLLLVLLPPILFYVILLRFAIDIPLPDDFHALLNFVNVFHTLPTAGQKASFFYTEQHGEYRLFFEHAVLLLQYKLSGHINLPLLATLGNCSILALGVFLWKMFLPSETDTFRRLMLFVPVSFLLFQLHYVEDLDYPMNALQNVAILPFLFGTLYFLHRPGARAFALSLVFLFLSVCTSGNGLFLIFIGAAVLAFGRRFTQLAAWSALSVFLFFLYFFRYPLDQLLHHPTGVHHSLLLQFLVRKPVFFLSFLGSAAGHPFKAASVLLGIAFLAFFAWLVRKGFQRLDPLVSWCIFTILFTALGVSYTRAEYGVFGSLSSRYGVYSDLLLIFSWFALVTLFLKRPQDHPPRNQPELYRNRLWLSAFALSALFLVGMDTFGIRLLQERNQNARSGMALYLQPGGTAGPVVLPPSLDPGVERSINAYARPVLDRSIALGVYQPPTH